MSNLSKNTAHAVKVSEQLEIVVAYEEDQKLRKESGWWISRTFNPKTCYWIDHARPGYGVTYWLTVENAKKFGLEL